MKSIKVSASRSSIQKTTIKGVTFFVGVSPYFFPERLDCSYEKNVGALVIRFRYLDNEMPEDRPKMKDGLLEIYTGKYTGRILSVTIHVDRNNLGAVEMLVSDEVPKAIRSIAAENREIKENHRLAAAALAESASEIATPV